jgi:hypothetical protein
MAWLSHTGILLRYDSSMHLGLIKSLDPDLEDQ